MVLERRFQFELSGSHAQTHTTTTTPGFCFEPGLRDADTNSRDRCHRESLADSDCINSGFRFELEVSATPTPTTIADAFASLTASEKASLAPIESIPVSAVNLRIARRRRRQQPRMLSRHHCRERLTDID